MLPDITKMVVGDTYVISGVPGDLTQYGIQWPDINLRVVRTYNKPQWEIITTPEFYDFAYYHFFETGISYNLFDDMVKKRVGIRCWSSNFVRRGDKDKFLALQERRLEIHHEKVLSFEDFELTERQKTREGIKLAEIMYKMRLGVLSRLDKRYRNVMEVEQNISESLAKVIIARKNKEAEE